MRLGLLFVGALFSMTAWADAPMPGYTEKCTVEVQQQDGVQCKSCGRTPDKDDCDKTLGAEGYSKRCERQVNGGWQEVWCIGGAQPANTKPPASVTPPTKQGGCAVAPGESSVGSLWLLSLGLGLLFRRPRTAGVR